MEEGEKKTSKYSSGINILIRLDGLWKDANNHSRLGLFQKWNCDLDRIWCELARDLKDDDYKDKEKDGKKILGYKSQFEEFDSKIAKDGKFEDNGSEGFQAITQEQIEKRNKHYKTLMEKDLFLRRLENSLGKGTTWDEGDEDDFE